MKLLWKLLRHHISTVQLIGFAVSNLLGISILLLAIQFYTDVSPLFSSSDGILKKEFVVVSKKVSTLGVLFGKKNNTFSDEEIDKLSSQSVVSAVGAFTPCRYQISAGISLLGQNVDLSTQLFFESVPDSFLDVKVNEWKFDEGQDEVPIILPKNYLDLYNFGFAQSRNLPQLTGNVLGMIQIDLYIRGNGLSKRLKGRVVGFSSRLNTLLVPESFVEWSNNNFAQIEDKQGPSRLIVEVTNPADKNFLDYLQAQGYDTENENQNAGKMAYFFRLLVMVVAGIGSLIVLLSLFILILSIYLLLQKNSTKLRNLMLIGYSVKETAKPYQWLTSGLLASMITAACCVVILIRQIYLPYLEPLQPALDSGISLIVIVSALTLLVLLIVLNNSIISRKLFSIRKN